MFKKYWNSNAPRRFETPIFPENRRLRQLSQFRDFNILRILRLQYFQKSSDSNVSRTSETPRLQYSQKALILIVSTIVRLECFFLEIWDSLFHENLKLSYFQEICDAKVSRNMISNTTHVNLALLLLLLLLLSVQLS